MDIMHVSSLQAELAQDLVDTAPSSWSSIDAWGSRLAGAGTFGVRAYVGNEARSLLPFKASSCAADLQDAMFETGKGSWFSFTCSVESSGKYHFTFNYDEPVMFGEREPLRDSWIKELRRHPRPWHLIPYWHPVKQDFTEQQWADDIAAYEASDEYRDPGGQR